MDTSNMNTSVQKINSLGFTNIWSGSAYEAQSEQLTDTMTKLNQCIADVSEFDAILLLKDLYVALCNRISQLSAAMASCASGHTKEQEDKGCSTCAAYAAEIVQKEKERKELREKIIALLGQFSGIDPEIAPPADLTVDIDPTTMDDFEGPQLNPGEIPLYDQNDYKDVKYGSGTVATSGCGITCAAMIISAYTGQKITPDMLAKEFNIQGASNVERMTAALDAYGIVNANNWNPNDTFDTGVEKYDYKDVKEKLKQGYTAIIYMNKGDFTNEGHLVVATGVNDDGKIMINDPNGNNYTKGNSILDDGYKNGFNDSTILGQWSGCWLIEPAEDYKERKEQEGN